MTGLPVIGRDKRIVEGVAKKLHAVAQRGWEYAPRYDTARGQRFDLRVPDEDSTHRWIVRVTVELERIEQIPRNGD